MLGPIRIVLLVLVIASAMVLPPACPGVEEAPAPAGPGQEPGPLVIPGGDVAQPFVPLRPRTAQERNLVEALRDYNAARALEDQRSWSEAIRLLESAHEKDPDSVAILRRLSRLCFALGRFETALKYGKRVVEADPDDTETLRRLIDYQRRHDAAGVEALLTGVLANPKLDKTAPARLLVERHLGDYYSSQPNQVDKAADTYAKLVEALDDKAATKLSLADQKRILGDEAESYAKFGATFYDAKRYDLAIKAFRRGLVYDPEHDQIPLFLAQALLKSGKAAEALETLEAFLKRQPANLEAYEILAQALKSLQRPGEIIPRLEKAVAAEPKNAALQYALADRYREDGQGAKATRLLEDLIASQPDPQGLGAVAESLRKEKKTDELLRFLDGALGRPGGSDVVKGPIEAIIADPDYADEVLAAGLKLLDSDPPGLGKTGRNALVYIATKANKPDVLIALDRQALKRDPSPETYRELFQSLYRQGNYDEAATVLSEMLAKFPDQKDARLLNALAQTQVMAGKNDAALATAREAADLDPNDFGAQGLIGLALGRLNRHEEAIAHYKGILERFPDNDEVARVVHSGLSTIYVNQDEFEKAEDELELLLEKDPDDAGVNNDLGYLYADQGKELEKAEAMIRKAVEEDPENAAYLDSLGWVLFKRGKVKEAVEPLEKAAKAKETANDATIHDHLGDVYSRLQQYGKARAAWERAEKIAAGATPPDRRLPEIRKKLEALKQLAPPPRAASGENP